MNAKHVIVAAALAFTACGDSKPSAPPPAPPLKLRPYTGPPLTGSPAAKPAAAPAAGGFRVLQRLVRDPAALTERQRMMIAMNNEVLLEIAADLNKRYRLPRDVSVRMAPCGTANAAYLPDQHAIIFCDEFVDLFARLFAGIRAQDDFEDAVVAATAFFFLHEVGHALIGELDLPALGNEESAADTYAMYLLLQTGHEREALAAADTFAFMAADHQAAGLSVPAWDVHGLNEQRFFQAACLIYGSDPARYAGFVPGVLPAEKAAECPDSWQTSARRIEKALAGSQT